MMRKLLKENIYKKVLFMMCILFVVTHAIGCGPAKTTIRGPKKIEVSVLTKEKEDLIGPVRSMVMQRTDYYTDEKNKRKETPLMQARVLSFDPQGNMTEKNDYDGQGKLLSKTTFSYDQTGKLSKESYYPAPMQEVLYETTYVYDENGILREKVTKYSNNTVAKVIMTYNKQGNMVESQYYNDVLFRKGIFIFDQDGNIIKKTWYNRRGAFEAKEIYTFDKKGNKLSESYYNSKGICYNKSIFKYNDDGKIAEKDSYGLKGKLSSKELFIYKEGALAKKYYYFYDVTGSLLSKSVYEFDNNGNQVLLETYDGKGKLVDKQTFNYTFDKHGNWT